MSVLSLPSFLVYGPFYDPGFVVFPSQSEEDNDDGGSDYEEDSDDDYRRAPPPAKKGKKANFKRTPAKTSSAKKGRGRPPAAKAAKGRGRPPAKGKGKKKASKYYDGDSEDDVVYRYVNSACSSILNL